MAFQFLHLPPYQYSGNNLSRLLGNLGFYHYPSRPDCGHIFIGLGLNDLRPVLCAVETEQSYHRRGQVTP